MALIADSGAIFALYDAGDAHHTAVRRVLARESGAVIIPAAILAEIDCLLRTLLGTDAELDFLDGLLQGAYTLEPTDALDLARCRELVSQYRDLDIDLADAAVAATAERLGVSRILTVDLRHFRALRRSDGKPFLLLPADASRSR